MLRRKPSTSVLVVTTRSRQWQPSSANQQESGSNLLLSFLLARRLTRKIRDPELTRNSRPHHAESEARPRLNAPLLRV